MSKSANQKLKLLYVLRLLYEQSSEDHPISLQDLGTELAALGVRAERKSLYSDINALREFGLDVQMRRGKTTGYYLASGGPAHPPAAGGEELTLRVEPDAYPRVQARFGMECSVQEEEDLLWVTVHSPLDQDFWGWLLAQGREIRLTAPKSAVKKVKKRIKELGKAYKV